MASDLRQIPSSYSDVNKNLGPKIKDLGHKAKAKDLDFGLKDQGQGLTPLSSYFQRFD